MIDKSKTNYPAGLHNEDDEIQTLQEELDKVQAEQSTLPSLIEEVQIALDAEAQQAQKQAKRVDSKEKATEKTLSGVQRALQMYEDRLGLKFYHNDINEEFSIVFTQLDPSHPSKEFKATILVLEGDRYKLCSSSPFLSNGQALIDELNATNNFSNFITALRKSFMNQTS